MHVILNMHIIACNMHVTCAGFRVGFVPQVRKSRDFYLDFLDLISVGLPALANN